MHQHATIGDTVYFWFAANDTSGSGGDGASAVYDVREAGAASDAAPLLSGNATLLSHADYPAGAYEVAVAATTGNGFAANDTFAVFCTLAIDSENPTGFVGSCLLTPLATAAALSTAQADLDIITGASGVVIANDSITAAKIADNAFANEHFAAGALTSTEIISAAGITLADDAITSDKFDESTAFPLAKADSGSDELARTGADGDTLEDLSDQIDDIPTNSELADAFTEIKGETWSSVTDTLEMLYDGTINSQLVTSSVAGMVSTVDGKVDNVIDDTENIQSRIPAALVSGRMSSDAVAISGNTTAADNVEANIGNLDVAVSSRGTADPGDEMDLVDAPNSTAVTAIQSGLAPESEYDTEMARITANVATASALATTDSKVDGIATQIGTAGDGLTGLPDVTLANGAHGGAAASIILDSYSAFTGEAAANPNVLQDGTITVSTQTSFTLSTGSADDDAYNSMVIVLEDASTATQKSVRTITDYTGSTKTVTIDSAPDFTIATSDNFNILAVAPGSTPPTVGQIRTEMDDNSTKLAAILEDVTGLDGDAMRGTDGANTVVPDVAGTAATPAEVATALETYDAIKRSEATTDVGTITSAITSAFTEIKGDTWSSSTDTLEDIRDNAGEYAPTVGEIRAELEGAGTKITLIKDATDNLPSDPADQSAVEAAITSAHSTTDGKLDNGTYGLSALKTLIDACSTHSAADVWSVVDRVLTAGTNLNDISAADVAAELETYDAVKRSEATTDKNTITSAITTAHSTTDGLITTADAVIDLIYGIVNSETFGNSALKDLLDALNDITVADIIAGISDGTYDLQEMVRIGFAILAGKSTGGGTSTINFRDTADSKNRMAATVDANGNRTAVTLTGS